MCNTNLVYYKMQSSDIAVHRLSHDPTVAWKEVSQAQKIIKINVKPPTKPVDSDKVRFVCLSDTHSLIHNIKFDIPDGDVLLHAGDFTKCGQKDEVVEFDNWLSNLPHKHKIVIAGNHELSFDPNFASMFKRRFVHSSRHTGLNLDENEIGDSTGSFLNIFKKTNTDNKDTSKSLSDAVSTENIRQYLKHCTYLEDSQIEIYGIKIYGSPWQPEFGNWAFNLPRGEECLKKWNQIPDDTDILLTHTPPIGHGDLVCSGIRAGCVELLSTVQQRVKPRYHVFGHIHEGRY